MSSVRVFEMAYSGTARAVGLWGRIVSLMRLRSKDRAEWPFRKFPPLTALSALELLLLALIAIIIIVALIFLGPIISQLFQNVGTTLNNV